MDVFERIKDIADEFVDEGGVIGDMADKDVRVLEALKNIIKEATRCIEDIAEGHNMGDRAHGYCVAQLLTALDNDHSYLGGGTFTVQDLADAITAKEDASEAEADHSDDICPCGDPDCNRPFGHEENEG